MRRRVESAVAGVVLAALLGARALRKARREGEQAALRMHCATLRAQGKPHLWLVAS